MWVYDVFNNSQTSKDTAACKVRFSSSSTELPLGLFSKRTAHSPSVSQGLKTLISIANPHTFLMDMKVVLNCVPSFTEHADGAIWICSMSLWAHHSQRTLQKASVILELCVCDCVCIMHTHMYNVHPSSKVWGWFLLMFAH